MSEIAQMLMPSRFPLWGSRLIEASAGTGKTYTIAALYVRLILGHGQERGQEQGPLRPLGPKEILVMTFTKAATQELTTRIQQRLTQTAQIFRGQMKLDPRDQFLRDLLDDYPSQSQKDNAAWLLNEAAQCMDESCIYTIDAWCQRVLKEYAVYSGQPFDEELVSNQAPLRQQAIEDFWRQSVYPLSAEHAQLLKAIWPKEMDDLERLVAAHAFALENSVETLEDDHVADAHFDLNGYLTTMLQERALKLKDLKQEALSCIQSIRPWLESISNQPVREWNLSSLVKRYLISWLAAIEVWCLDDQRLDIDLQAKHWRRISLDSIQRSRLEGAGEFYYPPQLLDFERIGAEVFSIKTLKADIEDYCLKAIDRKVQAIKRQHSTFGFTDLLLRLDAKLHHGNATILKGLIKKQYPAILIDEFQDTSALQYSIFNTIYEIDQNDRHHLICLIADPKQSIYAFRGADIQSYMRAKAATSPRHYFLGQNFRSTAPLVDAVNRWFSYAQTHSPLGAFLYKIGTDDDLPFHPVQANGLEQWIIQTQECAESIDSSQEGASVQASMPSVSMVCDLVPNNAENIKKKFAAICAEKIVSWLNDDAMSFVSGSTNSEDQKTKKIKPADIAILVRTANESVAVRHALSLRGVASVFLSDKDSVFQTTEARDLMFWLDAVANPRLADKVRAGLATATMGLEIDEIQALGSDDRVYDSYSEIIAELHQLWLHSGVLAMLRATLHRLSLPKRWLSTPQGERRLTNYLHLSELLQVASLTQVGMQSLQKWLASTIQDQGFEADEHILRLESDADLVKVITIHKSKGLEFPLVCLPFPTLFNSRAGKKEAVHPFSAILSDHADEGIDEELRESMRLLYVALTRAKYALWLGFSLFKDGRSHKDLTHRSALGYLLGSTSTGLKPHEWEAQIDQFFKAGASSGFEECVFLQPALKDGPTDEGDSSQQGRQDKQDKQDNQDLGQGAGTDVHHGEGLFQELRALLKADDTQLNALVTHRPSTPLRPPRSYVAHFERHFKIQSFSSLLRSSSHVSMAAGLLGGSVVNDDELLAWEAGDDRAADRLPPHSTPQPKVLPLAQSAKRTAFSWREMPGGMKVGTFMHDTLQWMIQEGLDALASTAFQKKLRHKIDMTLPLELTTQLSVHSLGLERERDDLAEVKKQLVEDFAAWLEAIVTLPLQQLGVNLKEISKHLCEMEFWLPVESFHAHHIERVCRQFIFPHLERQTLLSQHWQGLLMGFADLIVEHDGRYWLLDYKSNDLGLQEDAYSVENMQRHVVKNRYDLQMAIYLVALHRLLKKRLGSRYQAAEHLGGGMLWYLRGVDSPSQGICTVACSLEMIEALDSSILGGASSQKLAIDSVESFTLTQHD